MAILAVGSNDESCGNLIAKACCRENHVNGRLFNHQARLLPWKMKRNEKVNMAVWTSDVSRRLIAKCMIVPVPNFVFSCEVNEDEKRRPLSPEQWTMQLSIHNDKE